ncbi:Bartonella effector protein (Bep); substrate of VirB T4SS [Bartonella clarridgeiae 73]|uniref:protein adenylyltransferase n=1 Tax=Bartonella clarridgeiae (strain CCUG 45776 / CIP 104772 / 73) TaxID=696125 RepID=E6YHI3_BARC7|nr:BID domain-containing T4SS effector [Bartonella clarridgeiae]WCR55103.1 MAG: Fic domain protein BH13370 type [Bartonella clarridgeiae]CBI76321.1 Bartonella effector protein (Bep); substrate of VirB T4SS [Bartonella clarridgeiae 73]
MVKRLQNALRRNKNSSCDYTYSGSNTLKNKHGIQDSLYLDKKSQLLSEKIAVQLRQEPLPKNFDSSYLKYLHKCLFEEMFEWAGHTRDLPFTFADGTTAEMVNVTIPNSDVFFQESQKIAKSLQKFDQALIEKKQLKDLSREKFVEEAVKLFSFLNYVHPFRDGNGRAQRMFFEKLAEAAGHQLDFSIATKQRMTFACRDAIPVKGNVNYKTMQHLFEDISNPKKVHILRNFLCSLPQYERNYMDSHVVIVPRDNVIYTGRYKNSSSDSIIIVTKDSYIVCCKDHLTPEKLKTLKCGDTVTFAIPGNKDLDQILIPAEKLAPLKKEELLEKIRNDTAIQNCEKEIKHLSKLVYGNSQKLNRSIEFIKQTAEDNEKTSNWLLKHLSTGDDLAGLTICGIKTPKRRTAERNILPLNQKIRTYISIVESSKNKIMQNHHLEQKRLENSVEMPSKAVQDILVMPQDIRRQKLTSKNCIELQKELCHFLCKVNSRLSKDQSKAIRKGNYKEIAESIGMSESKAQTLIVIFNETREVYQQLQKIKMNRSTQMAMAI